MRTIPAALFAASLLIAGCSAQPQPEDATSQVEDGATRASGSGPQQSFSEADEKKKGQKDGAPDDSKGAGSEKSNGASEGPGTETSNASNDNSARSGERGGSGPDPASTRSEALQPRSGRYVYAQSGWEEFCAGPCRRGDLPPSAAIDTEVTRVDSRTLQVISKSKSSEDRSMRTTSLVSRSTVELTELQLTYGRFSNTYRPDPPVRSLELPLEVGKAWSSSWEADTSGTYSAEVLGREEVRVGNRSVDAFKLDTLTRFRGDFRGTMSSLVWVDPATGTTIRTHGKARIETDYGRFNSNFDTTLIDGPGYE